MVTCVENHQWPLWTFTSRCLGAVNVPPFSITRGSTGDRWGDHPRLSGRLNRSSWRQEGQTHRGEGRQKQRSEHSTLKVEDGAMSQETRKGRSFDHGNTGEATVSFPGPGLKTLAVSTCLRNHLPQALSCPVRRAATARMSCGAAVSQLSPALQPPLPSART